MAVEALRFSPFGSVQAYDFIFRQNELQLPPHQTAFAVDGQKLIERNEILMLRTGDPDAGVEDLNPVIRMLRHALAQRC